MLPINRMSKDERKGLSISVEGFFPVSKKIVAFSKQYKTIQELVPHNCDREVWLLITCITRAIRYGNTKSYMSFDNVYYHIMCHQYKLKLIDTSRLNLVINKLEEESYLTKYCGFKFEDDSSQSIVVFHDKLLALFDKLMCEKYGAARELGVIEMFETIKNYEGAKRKIPIDTKGLRGIGVIRKGLVDYNKVLGDTIICVNGERRTDVIYKRVFELCLTLAGRYYTLGSFLTTKKVDRQTTTLNNNQTVSLDFSRIQPAIIRTMLNLPASDKDIYEIEMDLDCDQEEFRNFCKVGIMCLLYNESFGSAVKALTSKLSKDKKTKKRVGRYWIDKEGDDYKYKSLHKHQRGLAKKVLEKLLDNNRDLEPMLFDKKLWAVLQGIESQIATHVINHFTSDRIPVIVIHDGFIVEYFHKERLAAIMEDAWLNVLGNTTHFGYSVEYDNTPKFSFRPSRP